MRSSPDPTRNTEQKTENTINNKRGVPALTDDRQAITKDLKHTPDWDLKIQREHEAKNPGPVRKNLKEKDNKEHDRTDPA